MALSSAREPLALLLQLLCSQPHSQRFARKSGKQGRGWRGPWNPQGVRQTPYSTFSISSQDHGSDLPANPLPRGPPKVPV